jgi:hypothetical protein
MGERSGESCRLSALTTEAGVEMTVYGKHGKTMKLFFPPFPQTLEIDTADFHIPTPRLRREDDYLLKLAGLRDTHSEGKVNP